MYLYSMCCFSDIQLVSIGKTLCSVRQFGEIFCPPVSLVYEPLVKTLCSFGRFGVMFCPPVSSICEPVVFSWRSWRSLRGTYHWTCPYEMCYFKCLRELVTISEVSRTGGVTFTVTLVSSDTLVVVSLLYFRIFDEVLKFILFCLS